LNASTDAELDAAFAVLVRQRAVAVLVAADPFFDTRRDQIIKQRSQRRQGIAGYTSRVHDGKGRTELSQSDILQSGPG
jgi:hypothetical protein